MIRTGEQYLESIRDGRRVLCAGEMIDDLTTHAKTRGYAQAVAEYYDMHHDPQYADAMTFVDEDGERVRINATAEHPNVNVYYGAPLAGSAGMSRCSGDFGSCD